MLSPGLAQEPSCYSDTVRLALTVWFAAGCSLIQAQPPAISQNGIVNSASLIPSALTDAAIARNSRFFIQGVRLGGNSKDSRVLLRHDGQSLILPLLKIEASRLEVWMPRETPAGPASLLVETAQGTSKPFSIAVVDSQIGLFSQNELGWGPGQIENIGADGKRTPNGTDSPAQPGQVVVLRATGLGDSRAVDILIGGRRARVIQLQRARDRDMDSLRVSVPLNAPEGCYVPVYARTPGLPPSNVVTMAIATRQSHCQLEIGLQPQSSGGQHRGVLGLSRTVSVLSADQAPLTTDEAFARFFNAEPSIYETNRIFLAPPAGTCTAYTGLFRSDISEFTSFSGAIGSLNETQGLDAGKQFQLVGAEGKSRIVSHPPAVQGTYWAQLGLEGMSTRHSLPLFLSDAEYKITGTGGKDIGVFTRLVPAPPGLQWSNGDQLSTIHRANGARIEWSGAAPDSIVLILALSFDQRTTAGGICYCTARGQTGSVLIPAELMAHFPATQSIPGRPRSGVFVVALRQPAGMPPPIQGLDELRILSIYSQFRKVSFD